MQYTVEYHLQWITTTIEADSEEEPLKIVEDSVWVDYVKKIGISHTEQGEYELVDITEEGE